MKKIAFLITFLMAGSVQAQTRDYAFAFNHVALSVVDVDVAAAFYSEILHLEEIKNRSEFPGIRWFDLGEGHELHLISIVKEEVTINKAVHLALSTTHFDELVSNLEENGIAYSDWPGKPQTISVRADGIRQIFFQDVDGYWIEVNNEIKP
jgi:catechol 2,3-dioxygenase-like lactoylglutathione lyase family enzyme